MRTIIMLSLALVLTGCAREAPDTPLAQSKRNHDLNETTFDAAALEMVQEDTGIQLPEGSRGLRMFYQGDAIDPSFVAKIRIPNTSGDDLAKRIEEIQNKEGTVTGSLAQLVTWWPPTAGTIRVERQWNPDGNYVRAILCQEDDKLVLYLEWIKV